MMHKSVLYTSIAQCLMEYREGRSSFSEELLEVSKKMSLFSEKVY